MNWAAIYGEPIAANRHHPPKLTGTQGANLLTPLAATARALPSPPDAEELGGQNTRAECGHQVSAAHQGERPIVSRRQRPFDIRLSPPDAEELGGQRRDADSGH